MKWIKRTLLSIVLIPMGLFLLLVVFFSVYALLNPWEVAFRLPSRYLPSDIFFHNSNGIVAGYKGLHLRSSPQASLYDGSFIYHSSNKGKNWKLVYEKENSVLTSISQNSKTSELYVLGRENNGQGEDTSLIIKSTDGGKNWAEYASYADILRGIDFSCSEQHYLWSSDQVFIHNPINNNTREVQFPSNCPSYSFDLVTDNACNLWIGCNEKLVKITKNGEITDTMLDKGANVHAIEIDKSNSDILFVTQNDLTNKTILHKYSSDKELITVKEFPGYFPNNLLISKDRIAIPFSNRENATVLGLEKILFASTDAGKTWKKDWHFPAFARSPHFLNDKELWVNSGLSVLEKRGL